MKTLFLHGMIFFFIILSCFGCGQGEIRESKTGNPGEQMLQVKKGTEVLYRSEDYGHSWESFSNGIPSDATLSGIEQAGNKIFITTDFHGVFFSENGKNDWTQINNGLPDNIDINCISVSEDRIAIGTLNKGVYVSTDGFSWKPASLNISGTAVRAFYNTGQKLIAGTDSGFFVSNDFGDSWSHFFGTMQILGFTSLNGKLYAAAHNGALVSQDEGVSWEYIYESDALHDISNDGKYIYAMTIGQQLLRTDNDGLIWENAQSNIHMPVNFYTNELKAYQDQLFSAQWIGVYHSMNGGQSWRLIEDLPDSTAFSTLEVTDYGILAGISIR